MAPTVIGFAYCHWREPKVLVRGPSSPMASRAWRWSRRGSSGSTLSGHAGQYWSFLVERSEGLTDRARLATSDLRVRLLLLRSSPLPPLTIPSSEFDGPRPRPPSSVVRSKNGIVSSRCQTTRDRYRLTNLDSDNIKALLGDPAIEDTSGIDRSSMRTPDGAFPWLYLQLQRYVPLIRLRVLPGFVKTVNAEPWLTDVTFFIPWFVLVVELLRRLTSRRPGHSTALPLALIVPTAVLSIITYQTLVRASPDSRLGDIVRADGRPARMGCLALVDAGRGQPNLSYGHWPSSCSCSRLRAQLHTDA